MAEAPVENAPGSRKAKSCDGTTHLSTTWEFEKKKSAMYDVLEAESNLTSFEHSKAMGVDTHLVSSTNWNPTQLWKSRLSCLKVLADEIAAPFREEIRQVWIWSI